VGRLARQNCLYAFSALLNETGLAGMSVASLPVVVLVECDPLVRYGYSVLVGDWGHEVVACGSTAEAAEVATGRRVSALVLGHDIATVQDGLVRAATLAQDLGGVPVALIAGRLQREVLESAGRLNFTLLSEADELDRLEKWLRESLTRPAKIES
jgi:CheY-like chemotaxis protein